MKRATSIVTANARPTPQRLRIGIVGGGFMGLALAQRLPARGHAVTIFERDKQVGGLATYHDYGPFTWDRFYHCLLPCDTHLLNFLRDIGLGEHLCWKRTLTGYYVDRQFYSMSNQLDFLRFPLVSLVGKIRLALTVLYCARVKDWHRLESITIEDWLIDLCGRTTYEKFWRPLLLAKLGEHYKRVSAVFIWTYIKRLFSARDSAVQKEYLGYVTGGYLTVLRRLEELIRTTSGDIRTHVAVENIRPGAEGGLWVEDSQHREHFDKVIFTSPVNVLRRVAGKELVAVHNSGNDVEYLGVVCGVLITKKPLTPYYVVNIADQQIPFTGVIGMSNLVSVQETANRHITYLPKYVLSTETFLQQSEYEVSVRFLRGLHLMFPDLRPDDVEGLHINKAMKVQPLQVLRYSDLAPQIVTKHRDFFVVNTAQFVNCTLNNNEVVRLVDEFLVEHGSHFEHAESFSRGLSTSGLLVASRGEV